MHNNDRVVEPDSFSSALWQQRAESALEAVFGWLLDDVNNIAQATVVAVKANVAGYRSVPESEIHAQAVENVNRAVTSLRAGSVPEVDKISEAGIARTRAEQGVPIEEVLQAYRISLGLIKDSFLAVSEGVLPTKSIIDGVRVLWESADAVTVQLSIHHHERKLWVERHDEQFRMDFLRRVLSGQVTHNDLVITAPIFGLAPDAAYIPIRARSGHEKEIKTLIRLLDAHGHRIKHRPLIGILDGDLAALVQSVPPLVGVGATAIGVGKPASLGNISEEWKKTTRVLETALAFGYMGIHTGESLGLRTLIVAENELGTTLTDRFISPLKAEGAFGVQVIHSVRVWLSSGKSIAHAAEELMVHPNTLRYRVRRFEEATGADLENSFTVIEVWWAIERWLIVDAR